MSCRRITGRWRPPGGGAPWIAHLLVLSVLTLALCATACAGLLRGNTHELVRRLVVLHARDALQRDVQLGALQYDLVSGYVVAQGLRVADQHPERPPLATVPRLEVRLDPVRLWAWPFKPVGAITRIACERPTLHLTRDLRGTWSFHDLLSRKRKPSTDRFRAEIVIVDGDLRYQDAHGWGPTGRLDERLTHLAARLTPGDGDYLPFHASAVPAGRARTVEVTGGFDVRRQRFQSEVAFAQVDLGYVRTFLPSLSGLTLHDGEATGRLQCIAGPDRTGAMRVEMTVLADVRRVHGALRLFERNVPLSLDTGQLRFTEGAVELVGMSGQADGVPVQVDGTIAPYGAPGPVLALQLRTLQAKTDRLIGLLPPLRKLPVTWGGTTTGWVQLTGTPQHLEVSGSLEGLSVYSASFGGVSDVQADFLSRGQSVQVTHLRARGFGGEISGNAWLHLAPPQAPASTGPSLLFAGDVRDVDLRPVVRQFLPAAWEAPPRAGFSVQALRGRASGPLTVRLAPAGTVTVLTQPKATVHWPDPDDPTKDRTAMEVAGGVRLDLAEDGATVTLDNVAVGLPEGDFRVDGTFDTDGTLAFAVHGNKVDLQKVAGYFGRDDLSGTGYLTGQLSGTIADPRFNGTLQAHKGKVRQYAFDDMAAEISAVLAPTPSMTVRNGRLTAGEGHITVDGTLAQERDAAQPWRLHGTARLSRTTLGELRRLAGIRLPIDFDGFVDGEVRIEEAPEGLPLSGTVRLHRPTIQVGTTTFELDQMTAAFHLRGDEIILDEGALSYNGIPFEVTGSVNLAKEATPQVSVRVRAKAIALDALTKLLGNDPPDAPLLTEDGRLRLPVDLQATCALDATVTAQLTGKDGVPMGETLARTLAAHATLDMGNSLVIGDIPFRTCALSLDYAGATRLLTLDRFTLARTSGERGYAFTLPTPATLQLDTLETDLALVLRGATPDAEGHPTPAYIPLVRADLTRICEVAEAGSAIAPLTGALAKLPSSFSGNGQARVTVQGNLLQPTLTAQFGLADLKVAGVPMPSIDGTVSYDTTLRLLNIERLAARSPALRTEMGPMTAELNGAVTFPESGDTGAAPLNLTLEAQQLDPAMVGMWTSNEDLRKISGTATISATIEGTLAHPIMTASLDVLDPVIFEVPFDAFNAIVNIEDDTLSIGDPALGMAGAATLQFKGSDSGKLEPLHFAGTLPLRWQGPLAPDPQKFTFTARLPRQGLDVIRAYWRANPESDVSLPPFPEGDGSVEGEVRGAIALTGGEDGTTPGLEIEHGSLVVRAPKLSLPFTGADLPDQLQDVVLDLSLREDPQNHAVSVLEINDLSAIYARTPEKVKKPSKWAPVRWVTALFGKADEKKPFQPGALTMQGAIRFDPARMQITLPDRRTAWRPLSELPNALEFDLYAKTVRAPLQWGDLVRGRFTGYLHLGQDPEEPTRPRLTGLLYAENMQMAYTGSPTEPGKPMAPVPLAMNLSLALQAGPGNVFRITPDSALLRSTVSAEFPFQPSDETLLPFSLADRELFRTVKGANAPRSKAPIEREHWAYYATAETFAEAPWMGGTRGWVSGTLAQPEVVLQYALQPRKAQVLLPTGSMLVESGTGELRFHAGDPEPLRLSVNAEATGRVDDYRVKANIETKNLFAATEGRLPIVFTQVSAPAGAPPLADEEIYARLIGVSNITSLLSGESSNWTPLAIDYSENWLINPWLRDFARKLGLDALSLTFDPALSPEASLITPEFGRTKWSLFQLGATHTFADQPTWKLWVDYRLPKKGWDNLAITTELSHDESQRNDLRIDLRYQFQFDFP